MRALKRRTPDRSTAERGTGTLICNLAFPMLKESLSKWFETSNPDRTMATARRFILKKLPRNAVGLEGASFAISAAVRKRSGGLGRKRLAGWRSGDPIEKALERAVSAWARLPKEEWLGEVVEIEL